MSRKTEVVISAVNVGSHFGCVGIVRRMSDRRVIYRTDEPRPYGFRQAAINDATDWAIAHGYIHITEDLRDNHD